MTNFDIVYTQMLAFSTRVAAFGAVDIFVGHATSAIFRKSGKARPVVGKKVLLQPLENLICGLEVMKAAVP